jgi:hypothetical protein
MRNFLIRKAAAFALSLSVAATASAQSHVSIKRPYNLAPSADLNYAVRVRQSGLVLGGSTVLKWQAGDGRYSVTAETQSPLFGKVLAARSEGAIDAYGLAPESFNERKLRRDAAGASFDRAAATIGFTASKESYPILGGEQDRSSIVWQLIANARAAARKFVAGSEWRYFVVGPNDADAWTFKVGAHERVDTPMGQFNAVHVTRVPNERGQQLDIWLAPALDWYPVLMRQTETDGDYFEQTLENVSKK